MGIFDGPKEGEFGYNSAFDVNSDGQLDVFEMALEEQVYEEVFSDEKDNFDDTEDEDTEDDEDSDEDEEESDEDDFGF